MEITSLTITYLGNQVWSYHDNTMPVGGTRGASFYDGTWDLDLVSFMTDNGGNIYARIPYSRINYVDSTDSSKNFTPISAQALIVNLKGKGFFSKGSTDGSGVATRYIDLTDGGIANYAGLAGQFITVKMDETGLTPKIVVVPVKIGDLSDVQTNMLPNSVLTTNSTGTIAQWVAKSSFNQPYYPFKSNILKFKGYTWQTISGVQQQRDNTQLLEQAGDIFEGWFCIDSDPEDLASVWVIIKYARWIGGDRRVAANFVYSQSDVLAFNSDPDFN